MLYNFGQLSVKDNDLVPTQFAVAIVKEDEMDEALLVLRIIFAAMIFGHATQKLSVGSEARELPAPETSLSHLV